MKSIRFYHDINGYINTPKIARTFHNTTLTTNQHWVYGNLKNLFRAIDKHKKGLLVNYFDNNPDLTLVSILVSMGVLDYGTSEQGAWLTDKGKALRDFVHPYRPKELSQCGWRYGIGWRLISPTDDDWFDACKACNLDPKEFKQKLRESSGG